MSDFQIQIPKINIMDIEIEFPQNYLRFDHFNTLPFDEAEDAFCAVHEHIKAVLLQRFLAFFIDRSIA